MSRVSQSRNNKFLYYLNGHIKRLYPKKWLIKDIRRLEKSIKNFDELKLNTRLDYYYQSPTKFSLEDDYLSKYDLEYWRLSKLKDISVKHGVYSLDLMEYTRFFCQEYKLAYMFGDITKVPAIPSVTKSRPVSNNKNSILMKFDKVRHFYFVKKDIPYHKKQNKLVWRGAVHQPHRVKFMQDYFNKSDLMNLGEFNKSGNSVNSEWLKPFMTIDEQLQYKFILSIEGTDVATNTKWIMSSNSLCFMPRPKFETWFMEGTLIPDYHYVLIKDDFSDLENKINYYIENSEEAENIISNANSYIAEFCNPKIEDWLHLKILEQYFNFSDQSMETPHK